MCRTLIDCAPFTSAFGSPPPLPLPPAAFLSPPLFFPMVVSAGSLRRWVEVDVGGREMQVSRGAFLYPAFGIIEGQVGKFLYEFSH